MFKPSLCDYSDACILDETTIGANIAFVPTAGNNTNKKVMFKNCEAFTDWISVINNI